MCFVSVCKQHLRDGMHKSWLIKTNKQKKKTWRSEVGGLQKVEILCDRFSPCYSAPQTRSHRSLRRNAVAGNEIKAAEYRCFDVCLLALVAMCFSERHIY